ncbi:MAG: hypothetical protein WC866_05070 [Patescibacteria group bacterium]|jgi:hypothetical protein
MVKKDEGQGLLDEAASQGKGAVVGVAAVVVAVPFFGWMVGAVVGGAVLIGSTVISWNKKRKTP